MNYVRLWVRLLVMVLWPPLMLRWVRDTAARETALVTELEKCRSQRDALQRVADHYESIAPEPLEFGDQVEFCGCDESKMLRLRLFRQAELERVCTVWREDHQPTSEDDIEQLADPQALNDLAVLVFDVIGWHEKEEVTS